MGGGDLEDFTVSLYLRWSSVGSADSGDGDNGLTSGRVYRRGVKA